MDTNALPTLPVVIVGKDRTRMTCAVIDALKAHIKNAKPYFICVSDRSREGHDRVVENHLKEIGETEYQVLRTRPEEERYGWGAAMNIGISAAFERCKDTPCVLVVDNDWILQKDLDIDKYLYAFAFSSIGAITFKHIYPGTNVSVHELKMTDGDTYLLRSKGCDGKYSFTAELGCMLITKRMYEAHRYFEENCTTDETEWEFCDWYNDMSKEIKDEKWLWFATDKELKHDSLNGEGHVFTHVGINSQHPGPQKWDCPEEYKYLSDEKEDEKVVCLPVLSAPEASAV